MSISIPSGINACNNDTGDRSTVFGIGSTSSGVGTFAAGIGVTASKPGQVALGAYNDPDDDSILSIGAGTGPSDRKTALKVNSDGSVETSGGIKNVLQIPTKWEAPHSAKPVWMTMATDTGFSDMSSQLPDTFAFSWHDRTSDVGWGDVGQIGNVELRCHGKGLLKYYDSAQFSSYYCVGYYDSDNDISYCENTNYTSGAVKEYETYFYDACSDYFCSVLNASTGLPWVYGSNDYSLTQTQFIKGIGGRATSSSAIRWFIPTSTIAVREVDSTITKIWFEKQKAGTTTAGLTSDYVCHYHLNGVHKSVGFSMLKTLDLVAAQVVASGSYNCCILTPMLYTAVAFKECAVDNQVPSWWAGPISRAFKYLYEGGTPTLVYYVHPWILSAYQHPFAQGITYGQGNTNNQNGTVTIGCDNTNGGAWATMFGMGNVSSQTLNFTAGADNVNSSKYGTVFGAHNVANTNKCIAALGYHLKSDSMISDGGLLAGAYNEKPSEMCTEVIGIGGITGSPGAWVTTNKNGRILTSNGCEKARGFLPLTTVTAVPTAAPSFVGEMQWDSTNKRMYFATGTSAVSDWKVITLGALPSEE